MAIGTGAEYLLGVSESEWKKKERRRGEGRGQTEGN